jgi:hypothetical protein
LCHRYGIRSIVCCATAVRFFFCLISIWLSSIQLPSDFCSSNFRSTFIWLPLNFCPFNFRLTFIGFPLNFHPIFVQFSSNFHPMLVGFLFVLSSCHFNNFSFHLDVRPTFIQHPSNLCLASIRHPSDLCLTSVRRCSLLSMHRILQTVCCVRTL